MRTSLRIGLPLLATGWLWPSLAAAASVCAHPLSGQGACVGVFSLVSLAYAICAGSYALGALMILKPQVPPRRWKWGVLGAMPAGWLAAMVAFTVGGASGLLVYPHDASPFFFMDWFAALFTLITMTLYVVGVWRWGRQQASVEAPMPEERA